MNDVAKHFLAQFSVPDEYVRMCWSKQRDCLEAIHLRIRQHVENLSFLETAQMINNLEWQHVEYSCGRWDDSPCKVLQEFLIYDTFQYILNWIK